MSLILKEIGRLEQLLFSEEKENVASCSEEEKIKRLYSSQSHDCFTKHKWLNDVYEASDETAKCVILSVIALGQSDLLFQDPDTLIGGWSKWHSLIEKLKQVEKFYEPIGGLIGYQQEVLVRLAIHLGLRAAHPKEAFKYAKPPRIDIRAASAAVKETILAALKDWDKIALLMPIGGAGDRLGLEDSQGHPLPASFLPFEGKTLLEGLIIDIEAIESLVYKTTGKKYITPIALMTSDEKNNHVLIEQFLKDHHYFGRPQESIRLFRQKMVPVVTEEGMWAMNEALDPMLKPGGHGALWRSCEIHGVLQWLEKAGKTHGLVRQVNNPIAATDINFLALAGYGLLHPVAMVLLTCERLVHASEGVNVLRVRHEEKGVKQAITNIEYTDFAQENIEDAPEAPGSPYSAFTSNTNLFLIELAALKKALAKDPFPGMILNLKSKTPIRIGDQIELLRTGRLESMMQNIADAIETPQEEALAQALLFSDRSKVISVAKKKQPENGFALETPASAFYDRQRMFRDFLATRCSIDLPLLSGPLEYFHKLPPILIHLDPRLGPVHSLMAQRIHGGTLSLGSFLQLHLQHLICRDIYLDGALDIEATCFDQNFVYLNRVSIVNGGWMQNKVSAHELWQKLSAPQKRCRVVLEGKSAFIASQVVIESDRQWVVKDGKMLIISGGAQGELCFEEKDFDEAYIQRLGFEKLYQDWVQSLASAS
jgi:hypothetical protein